MNNISNINKLIIKIGSSVISDATLGINYNFITELSNKISELKKTIPNIVIVSSGSVAAGFRLLGFSSRPTKIIDKQASAAVGQARLIQAYDNAFKDHNINVAQILITKDDLSNRKRFLNAKRAIMRLLDLGVIPIINENDTILVDELKYIESFGDNDNLSALVASMIDASLLLILSDVDGVYNDNPNTNVNAKIIHDIDKIDKDILNFTNAVSSGTSVGSGGMRYKLLAAKKACMIGCDVAIINGQDIVNIDRLFNGEEVGTYIHSQNGKKSKGLLNNKKFWIENAAIPRGGIVIDLGAVNALKNSSRSLLAKGIVDVKGKFNKDDIVSVFDINNLEIARGKSRYTSVDIMKIKQKNSNEIENILGYNISDEIIHRDDLIILLDI